MVWWSNDAGPLCHENGPLRDAVAATSREKLCCDPIRSSGGAVRPPTRAQNIVARPTMRASSFRVHAGLGPTESEPRTSRTSSSRPWRFGRLRCARRGKWGRAAHDARHSVGKKACPAALPGGTTSRRPADAARWSWDPVYRDASSPPRRARALGPRARTLDLSRGVADLAASSIACGYSARQRLRETRKLPRFVHLVEEPTELGGGLDNVLSARASSNTCAASGASLLCEMFPAQRATEPGLGGSLRGGALGAVSIDSVPPAEPSRSRCTALAALLPARSGSTQSSCEPSTRRRAARGHDAPSWLVRARASVARFTNGSYRLREHPAAPRVRCHGKPRFCAGQVLPALRRALEPALVAGDVERLALDRLRSRAGALWW